MNHGVKPLEITSLNKERIVKICAGYAHALALTDEGKLYSWGANQFGQLGHGDLRV